jgi:hypothetical protein
MLDRFIEEAARAKGESLDDFALRAGREAAADAIRGIYRFFAMVLTPPALLGKASQMWGSLFNRGEMRVEDQQEQNTGEGSGVRSLIRHVAGCGDGEWGQVSNASRRRMGSGLWLSIS